MSVDSYSHYHFDDFDLENSWAVNAFKSCCTNGSWFRLIVYLICRDQAFYESERTLSESNKGNQVNRGLLIGGMETLGDIAAGMAD